MPQHSLASQRSQTQSLASPRISAWSEPRDPVLRKPEGKGHPRLSPDRSPAVSSMSVMMPPFSCHSQLTRSAPGLYLSFPSRLSVNPLRPSAVSHRDHCPAPPGHPFLLPWPPSQIMGMFSCPWPAAMIPTLSSASLTILHTRAPPPGATCSPPAWAWLLPASKTLGQPQLLS